MATATIDEESLDLSTCSVCLEPYDKDIHKPKFLSCAHTYCLNCIKAMAPAPATQLTCSVCKKVCELPAIMESLPTNHHAMCIIQWMNKAKDVEKSQKNWCETCDCLSKPICQPGNHILTDFVVADSAKSQSQLTEVSNQLNEAVANRKKSQEHLQADTNWLRNKLETTEAKMEENNGCLLKLYEAIELCEGMKKLSNATKAAASTKIKLEKMLNVAKDRLKEAQEFFSRVVAEKLQTKTVTDKAAGYTENIPSLDPVSMYKCQCIKARGSFAANCFAVHRQQLDPSQMFHCQDLTGHASSVYVVEFSEDGTMLASGGTDKIVRLWPLSNAAEREQMDDIVPIEMEARHESSILSLTFTSDRGRLFSGESIGKVFIHDVATKKLIGSMENLKCVRSISIQPDSDGNVFAVACDDSIIRIFDIRRSISQPVMLPTEFQQPIGNLYSVTFSPAEPHRFAAAGTTGTRLFNIRNNATIGQYISFRYLLFPIDSATSAKFNTKGNRLLCRERNHVVVYKVPSEQPLIEFQPVEKIKLKSPEYSVSSFGLNICCFAGQNDELVVASSVNDHSLHVWSVPDEWPMGNRTIDQSLLTLRGHQQFVNCVRYSKATSSMVSCGKDSVIKLWSPTAVN